MSNSNTLRDLLNYAKSRDSNRFRLRRTTPLESISSPELQAVLREFDRQGGAKSVLALVLNSLVTHRLPIFHLGQGDVQKLLKQAGVSIDLRANSSAAWKGFLAELDRHGHFVVCLRPSSRVPRRPAVYELRHPALLPLVDEPSDSLRREVISVFHAGVKECSALTVTQVHVDTDSKVQGVNVQGTSEVAATQHTKRTTMGTLMEKYGHRGTWDAQSNQRR